MSIANHIAKKNLRVIKYYGENMGKNEKNVCAGVRVLLT